MFKIHQIRLGLATNSSSSHSLILLPHGAQDHGTQGNFGWDFFTSGSRESKLLYAAITLRSAMLNTSNQEISRTVAEAWTGVKLADDYFENYIDHQSLWALPLSWDARGVDQEFFEDLKAFLLREDLVILGGNDNDDNKHPLDKGSSFQLPLPRDEHFLPMVCRKTDGYWVLFNRDTGTKIRMSFDCPEEFDPIKARTPELIDVKITDFCPYNCPMCYQDSTSAGKHADFNFLLSLARACAEMKVFEVALGGGEPTLHPKFFDILSAFRRYGVVPNFTTRNLTWLHDPVQRPKVLKTIGAFAYSVETPKDIAKIATIKAAYEIPNEKINCQYIMGSQPKWDFEALLRTAANSHVRLTLLGYKQDGRGSAFKPHDYSGWCQTLKSLIEKGIFPRIGIDTALAAESKKDLDDLEVPTWCYEVVEGKFSMYVDAVTQKTARSSYGPGLIMRPLKVTSTWDLTQEISLHFAIY